MRDFPEMRIDQHITVNGISVSYDDSGEGGSPLIFIHGFPFDRSSWEPQADHFKKTNRVICYDIRGFGGSTSDRERPRIDLFADDLVKLMDALKIEKAIVCGLSMGGYILLNAVNRYPKRFKAIILCDTQCLSDSKEGIQNRFETIREIEENGLNDFADQFIQKAFSKKSLAEKKEVVEATKNVILSNSSEAIVLALEALAKRKETCSILRKINVPTLVLCGENDAITPIPRSEFLCNTIPNAQMHIIKDAGHLSNIEQPGIFNGHIDQFIHGLEN